MSTHLRKRSALIGAVVFALGASIASAANITFLQFSAQPDAIVPGPKEFIYDPATGLTHGPGSIGGGPISDPSLAPGLNATITGGVQGIAQSPPGVDAPPPYNILSDLTLTLTGFAAVGNAVVGGASIEQGLGAGTFQVSYTPTNLVILEGTASSALIVALNGSGGTAGTVLSGVVTYTGGILLTNLADAGLSTTGAFSFAMTGLTGTFGTVGVNGDTRLIGFSADATGSFDAAPGGGPGPLVPSPSAVWAGAGLLGFLGAVRFSRRRTH